jgi:hypothetical protein
MALFRTDKSAHRQIDCWHIHLGKQCYNRQYCVMPHTSIHYSYVVQILILKYVFFNILYWRYGKHTAYTLHIWWCLATNNCLTLNCQNLNLSDTLRSAGHYNNRASHVLFIVFNWLGKILRAHKYYVSTDFGMIQSSRLYFTWQLFVFVFDRNSEPTRLKYDIYRRNSKEICILMTLSRLLDWIIWQTKSNYLVRQLKYIHVSRTHWHTSLIHFTW